jgi:putative membrane protein
MTTWHLLMSCWRLDPLALFGCAVAIALYIRASAIPLDWMSRRARPGSRVRAAPFAAGLLVLALALLSPVGTLAEGYLFSAHMLQHLMLVLLVPPLLLLGFAGKESERYTAGRITTFASWGLGVGAMWLWHAPTLCNAASQSALMHRLQEASLLAMGTAFWWPILAPRASQRLPPLGGVVYLFTACVACTLLGIAITFSPVEVCSVFAHPVDRLGVMPLLRDGWGLTAERDQQIGGLLMWVPACVVYGAAILAVLARVFRETSPAREQGPSEVA